MKVAVAGKGGSGKTTIAGTLARVMAERGQRVVAIDDDSNPNLALTVGVDTAAASRVPGIPRDMLEERADTILPSALLDAVLGAASSDDLGGLLARLLDDGHDDGDPDAP